MPRIEIDFDGDDGDGIRSIEKIVGALRQLERQANKTGKDLDDINVTFGDDIAQVKALQKELDDLARKAREADRAIDSIEGSAVRNHPLTSFMRGTFGDNPYRAPQSLYATRALVEDPVVARLVAKLEESTRQQTARLEALAASENRERRQDRRSRAAVDRYNNRPVISFDGVGDHYDRDAPGTKYGSGPSAAAAYLASRAGRGGGSVFGGGTGGGGGGGRRSGGYDPFSFGDNDNRFQTGDLVRGILPGGRGLGPGATMLAGSLGLGTAKVLGPGAIGLLAAIPGLATAGIAAVAGLAAGFGGLGDAIDGDKEAFDKLTPSTQKFVQEIRSLIPWLKETQELLREGLFAGTSEGLRSALSPETVQMFEESMRDLGLTLGDVAAAWGEFVGSESFASRGGQLAQAAFGWIASGNDTLIELADLLLDVTVAGIPFTDWLMDGINSGAEWANTWVAAKIASGEFNDVLEEGKDAIRLVLDVLASAGRLVFEFADALDGPAENALRLFIDMFDELARTLDENEQEIEAFINGGINALADAVRILWPILKDLLAVLDEIAQMVGGWETAFQIIITGALAKTVLDLGTKFLGLAFGIGTADVAAGGLLGKLRAIKGLGPIAVTLAVLGLNSTGNDQEGRGADGIWRSTQGGDGPPQPRGAQAQAQLEAAYQAGKIDAMGNPTPGGVPRNRPDEGSRGVPAGIQIPTSVKGRSGVHETAGLEGFPAIDIMAKSGTPVKAPEDGRITRVTKHNPNPAYFGQGIYFVGTKSGNTYYIKHVFGAAPPGSYKKGAVIAYVAHGTKNGDHAHIGISQGIAAAAGGPSDLTPGSDPFGTPPPFEPGSEAKKSADTTYDLPYEYELALAKAGLTKWNSKDDLAAYRAAAKRIRKDLPGLPTKDDPATDGDERGQRLSAISQLESMMNAINAILQKGVDKMEAKVRARKEAFAKAWGELARAALDAYDDETRKHRTVSELELEKLTGENDQAAQDKRLSRAEKALADAKALRTDPTGQIDAVRRTVGRYALANAVDIAQSAVLGGSHMNLGDQLIAQLQADLATSLGEDKDAIQRAEEQLAEVRYDIRVDGLRKLAAAERDSYNEWRRDERARLDESLAWWGEYFEKLGLKAAQAPVALEAIKPLLSLADWQQDAAQNVIPAILSGEGPAAIAQAVKTLLPILTMDDTSGMGLQVPRGGKAVPFADGGIVVGGPMLGMLNERPGSRGEAVIPLDRLSDYLGSGDVQVNLNFADGTEWLREFVSVEVVRNSDQVAFAQGTSAERLRREGRY